MTTEEEKKWVSGSKGRQMKHLDFLILLLESRQST
jgi:hypothetical protein